MARTPTVLLTGATGFLGRATCRALRDAGIETRALVRQTSDVRPLEACGVTHVLRTPLDGDLAAALEGVDVLIHCAGGARVTHADAIDDANVSTTRHLLAAARAVGVRRFVLVSSMAATGPAATPGAPPIGPQSRYGRAKAAAEVLVRDSGLEGVVLRPPALYGPGDDRLLPVFRAAHRGLVPVPRAARTTSFLHVDDCASALLALAVAEGVAGRAYGVDDGGPHPWDQLVTWFGAAVGTRARLVRVPTAALWALGAGSELWSRITRHPTIVHRDKVRDMLGAHWESDGSALRRDTGWAPRVTLPEGLRATARDHVARGWLAPTARTSDARTPTPE